MLLVLLALPVLLSVLLLPLLQPSVASEPEVACATHWARINDVGLLLPLLLPPLQSLTLLLPLPPAGLVVGLPLVQLLVLLVVLVVLLVLLVLLLV